METSNVQGLVRLRRDYEIRVQGLTVEIAMACGDRLGAERAKREMYALIEARNADRQVLREEGCYFANEGDAGRARIKGEEIGA